MSYPEEAGSPIGGKNFSRYVMLEVHYNNPDHAKGWSALDLFHVLKRWNRMHGIQASDCEENIYKSKENVFIPAPGS